jgi:hypothetical protein
VSKYLSRVQAHTFGAYDRLMSALRIAILMLLAACAGRGLDRDTAFRRIQVHEAEVARAQAALAHSEGCASAVEARALCAASRSLCEISSELADSDATARCLQAGSACDGAREQARARCAEDQKP